MSQNIGYDKRDYTLPSEETTPQEEYEARKKISKSLFESRKQMEICSVDILENIRSQRDEMYVPIFDKEDLDLNSIREYIHRALRPKKNT
jgi:hypothetical protein